MYTDVESLKKALEVNGFTSVKFPGGGGNMRQHSSIGLLWDVIKNKENNRSAIVLLVLPFRHIHPDKRVFHSSEFDTIGESPKKTVQREIFEESGIAIDEERFHPCCVVEVPTKERKIKKYSFSAKTSLVEYQKKVVTKEEVELGCGAPIVVELKTLIEFLIPMIDNTSVFNKVSLRRALEKNILFSHFTNFLSKWYVHLLKDLPVEETIYQRFGP